VVAELASMKQHALAEVQAVLRDACRGIGQPAALGDELALAVAFAPANFAHWAELRGIFGPAEHAARCLRDGPSFVDQGLVSDAAVKIAAIDAPNVFGLYLLRAGAAFGCSFEVTPQGEGLVFQRKETPSESILSGGRVFWPDGLYGHLQTYARKTHVPATEATRLSGAGAGLNDND